MVFLIRRQELKFLENRTILSMKAKLKQINIETNNNYKEAIIVIVSNMCRILHISRHKNHHFN